jgi:putative ABC transport system substrate-binding protein
MRRREFVRFLGAAAASAWPMAARAQQPGGTRRLGILMSVQDDAEGKAQLSGFMQALAGLGWIEGRNLQTQVRWGGGDARVAQMHAEELVGLKPDVILSQGTPVTAAFKRTTQSIPIVFVVVTDPVGDGFVAGLPHPGGNITGFLTSESAITAKMLELLKEIAPGLKRVAMLFNPDSALGHGAYYSHDFDAAAKLSKLELMSGRAYNDAEIEAVITSLAKEPRWSRDNARLFYVQPYRVDYFAGATKQSAGYLPLEIRRYQKCRFAFLRTRPQRYRSPWGRLCRSSTAR